MQFCGTLTCVDGACTDVEGQYQASCKICEMKRPDDDYEEDLDGLICTQCRAKGRHYSEDGVTLVGPEGS